MKTSNVLRAAVAVVAVLVLGAWAAVAWLSEWTSAPKGPKGSPPVRIAVKEGASIAAVAREMEARGVLRSARAFSLKAKGASIKPGVYDFSPADTPDALLRKMVDGEFATERVTFPEGFTLRQIAARLHDRKLIRDPEAFRKMAAGQGSTLRAASFRPPPNLEGYLFPDTYKFPVGSTDKQIAQRMLDNFERRVGKIGPQAPRPLPDIVVIASLIEREARVPQDRAKIAGVIYNRLQKNMPLQIDATVQYALPAHKPRLLFRDLKVDSPYNTYKIKGLPPGAICSPGLPSLEAALKPERHPFLYYVARPDGSHIFGRTMAEHTQNIARAKREAAQSKGG